MKTGTLLGPYDFEDLRDKIIILISSFVQGIKEKELAIRFNKKSLNYRNIELAECQYILYLNLQYLVIITINLNFPFFVK